VYGEVTVNGRNSTSDKWRSSHPCTAVMLDIAGLMNNDHCITDGLCCTMPVCQGRVMAIETLGRLKANALLSTETQREEKKAIGLDCWHKLKWGMKIGFSFSNQNPGGS